MDWIKKYGSPILRIRTELCIEKINSVWIGSVYGFCLFFWLSPIYNVQTGTNLKTIWNWIKYTMENLGEIIWVTKAEDSQRLKIVISSFWTFLNWGEVIRFRGWGRFQSLWRGKSLKPKVKNIEPRPNYWKFLIGNESD